MPRSGNTAADSATTASPAARPTYGLLLVGGGQTHQENYARAFAADPRCRLIGLTDEPGVDLRRQSLNLQLAAELQIPIIPDLNAALEVPEVDLVSICVEPERRGRVAAACAASGKHLYIDKPLATSLAAAREIVSAAEEHRVYSQMFSLVRTTIANRARAALDSGELGELTGLHCELLFAKGPAGSADLSHPRRERQTADRFTFPDSKRELFCVGLYPLVLFQWLTGAHFTSVFGTTSNYFFAEHQANEVEDFSCAQLTMSNGVEASLMVGRAGWLSHPSHGVHQVHLVGTRRTLTIDWYSPRLEIASDRGHFAAPLQPHPEDPMGFWSSTQAESGLTPKTDWLPVAEPLASDAACFLDCLEEDRPSDVPALMGARAVAAILSTYSAAASGKPVAIPDDWSIIRAN